VIGSVQVEIGELSRLAGSLDRTHTQLLDSGASRVSGNEVGNNAVADALHDFYGNWDYRRKALAERLKVLSDLLFKAADVYAENEAALKKAFTPGVPAVDGISGIAKEVAQSAQLPALGDARPTPTPTQPSTSHPDVLQHEFSRSDEDLKAQFQNEWPNGLKNNGMDANNFAYNASGNCTSYVAWRLNQLAQAQGLSWSFTNNHIGATQVTNDGGRMGNALTWGQSATVAGYPPNYHPSPGAVAWWDESGGKSSDGHVGVVRTVHADGTIEVEESSWGTSVYSVHTYAPGQYPTGFLHLLPGS
jgi:surface antigen